MHHVSAHGADERMINVHYYYYHVSTVSTMLQCKTHYKRLFTLVELHANAVSLLRSLEYCYIKVNKTYIGTLLDGFRSHSSIHLDVKILVFLPQELHLQKGSSATLVAVAAVIMATVEP